jgi:endonuclease-3 related protein
VKTGLLHKQELRGDEDALTLAKPTDEEEIRAYYHALFSAWGPQNWWPARTRFEMIAGAFLTQNTSWTNAERALANLRAARVLSIAGIRKLPLSDLENLIRASGYFRQKAARLKAFVEFLDEKYCGSLARMFARSTLELRKELLSLNGVGPETADSILLYAGNHPVFVVDAYTRRILSRHKILFEDATYEEIRELFQRSLAELAEHPGESSVRKLAGGIAVAPHPPSPVSGAKRTGLTQVYNEMHGLIVGIGKNYCKKSQPQCDGCPLQKFLRRVE